jgi:hypothetical protein
MKNNLIYFLFIIFSIPILVISCEKDTYIINGEVKNVSDVDVASASVYLYTEGTTDVKYSATTDTEGQFLFNNVEEGYYDISILADGYQESKTSIHLKNNLNQDIILAGSAELNGRVIDAQTGLGVDSVMLAFTRDPNVILPKNAQLIIWTDIHGIFNCDSFPTGTFRMIIDTIGFSKRIIDNIELKSGTNSLGDIALITPPEAGNYRIILSWGFDPTDLDAHITGPDGHGNRFHICYWNKATPDNSVSLDLDDSWRYGPETITIREPADGTYRYSVHNYSDQSANGGLGIYESPAHVEIYNSAGLIEEFVAPSADSLSGNTWSVFEMQVSAGSIAIQPANIYLFAADDSDMETFKMLDKNQ